MRKNWNEVIVQCHARQTDVLILGEINVSKYEISLYSIEGYDRFDNLEESVTKHGIVIYIKQNIDIKTKQIRNCMINAENILIKLVINNVKIYLWALYRQPKHNIEKYMDEILQIDKEKLQNKTVIYMGDININTAATERKVKNYKAIMNEMGYISRIKGYTRQEWKGNCFTQTQIDRSFIT